MPKFILIDHSITDFSGHHYQYAAHVLEAAERAGYRPVLSTHRTFVVEQETPWPIYPVYEFGFWPAAGESKLREVLFSAARWIYPLRSLFRPFRALLHLLSAEKLLRRCWSVLFRRQELSGGSGKAARIGVPRSSRADGRASAETALLSGAFARDTKKLFEKIELAEGDVVFLPTVSHCEMLGLLEFFKASDWGLRASWHLLFRRSLREVYEPHDQAQKKVDGIQDAFETFQRQVGGRGIHFYTDSAELTRQYNRLGGFAFGTLPIPHTYASSREVPVRGPVRVTYLGDARCEKGFHLLPPLVRALRKDYLAAGKACFIVQSNYNTREKHLRTVVARAELERFPASLVQLYERPLSSAEYKALLLASGIVLLPYDRVQYHARSSGILAEALAAGIPVIVPAGTWLSRQLLQRGIHDHYETLRHEMKLLRSYRHSELNWNPDPNQPSREKPQSPLEQETSCRFEIPDGATHLLATLVLRGEIREASFLLSALDEQKRSLGPKRRIFLQADESGGRCGILVRVAPEAHQLRLDWLNYGGNQPLDREQLRIDLLCRPPGASVPIGRVGLSFHDTREIPDLIREIIDHYPHYRKTAAEFAESWRRFHNADRLIAEIQAKQRQGPALTPYPAVTQTARHSPG